MYRSPAEVSRTSEQDVDLTSNFLRFLEDKEDKEDKALQALLKDLGICIAGFVYLNEDGRRAEYGFFGPAMGGRGKSYMIPYQRVGWPLPEQLPADEYVRELEKNLHGLFVSNPKFEAIELCCKRLDVGKTEGDTIVSAFMDGKKQPLRDAIKRNRCARAIDGLFYLHRFHQNPFVQRGHEFATPEYVRELPLQESSPLRGLRLNNDRQNEEKKFREEFGVHYVPYGELVAFLMMWRRLLRRLDAATQKSWKQVDWTGVATFESDLARIVNDPLTSISEELPARTQKCMQWLVKRIDGQTWEDDIESLLLFDNQIDALTSLQRIVQQLNDPPNWPRSATATDLERLADMLLARSEICALPPECTAAIDIFEAIPRLHNASRFPILPYYYWNALSKQRRTHLVIPVMGRATHPLRQFAFHGIAGVAVVDIRPLQSHDYTVLEHDKADNCDTDHTQDEWRLDTLKHLLLLVAAPQIDSLYYAQAQKAQTDRELAEYVYAIGHPLKNRLEPISGDLGTVENRIKQSDLNGALAELEQCKHRVGAAVRTSKCLDMMAELCRSSGRAEKMDENKGFLTRHPYPLGRKILHMATAAAPRLSIEVDSRITNGAGMTVACNIPTRGRNSRLFDPFFDDLIFELALNASNCVPQDAAWLRITVATIDNSGEAAQSALEFINPSLPVNNPEGRLLFPANGSWHPWVTKRQNKEGPKGGLRFLATALRSSGTGDIHARLDTNGEYWEFGLRVLLPLRPV